MSHVSTRRHSPWAKLADGGAGLELEDFLSFRVVRLAAALQRLAAREYLEPNGLSAPEWRILGFVRRYGPVRFGEITGQTSLDKAQVSRSVRRLQALGLLQAGSDDSHAQRLVLSATAAGRRLHQRILPKAARLQARLLSALTPAHRDALWRALEVLAAQAEPSDPGDSRRISE